jgi:hypothetical protein
VQHVGREVTRDNSDFIPSLAQNVAKNLPGSGANVEDAAKSANVKLPGPQHVPDQWIVQGNHAAQPDCRPARAIVELLDRVPESAR